jgi:hypothetical protein
MLRLPHLSSGRRHPQSGSLSTRLDQILLSVCPLPTSGHLPLCCLTVAGVCPSPWDKLYGNVLKANDIVSICKTIYVQTATLFLAGPWQRKLRRCVKETRLHAIPQSNKASVDALLFALMTSLRDQNEQLIYTLPIPANLVTTSTAH